MAAKGTMIWGVHFKCAI